MKTSRFMTALKSGNYTTAIYLAVIGLLLIFFPGFSLKTLCIIGGIGLLILGAVQLIAALATADMPGAMSLTLPGAILALIGGLFLCMRSGSAIGLTSTLLGVGILCGGITSLGNAMQKKKFGYAGWGWNLASAICILVIGALFLTSPLGSARGITVLLGIIILAVAVLRIIVTAQAQNEQRREDEKNNIFEAEYHDV